MFQLQKNAVVESAPRKDMTQYSQLEAVSSQPVRPLLRTQASEMSLVSQDGKGMSKARLARSFERDVRRISTLALWGSDGMLLWFCRSTGIWFLFYAVYCVTLILLKRQGIVFGRDILQLQDNYKPLLMQSLQVLAAFLVGVGLNESVSRYKSAMSAMLDLYENVEHVRRVLLSSTHDPKFRIAVQIHITWLIVLLRKRLVFFTEDFESSISELIPSEFRNCIVFKPEVLWSFDRQQAEVAFVEFVDGARLIDKQGLVKKGLDDMFKSWRSIAGIVTVTTPTTKHYLAQSTVQTFLCGIPLFNEDIVTLCFLPFVAALLISILHLSAELVDPWGRDYHDLPIQEVLNYLSVPEWFGDDYDHMAEAIAWLNRGMTENDWVFRGEHPIPREKRRGSHKGVVINFEDYRALKDMAGFASFEELLRVTGKDMNDAAARGRRMPVFLRWRDSPSAFPETPFPFG